MKKLNRIMVCLAVFVTAIGALVSGTVGNRIRAAEISADTETEKIQEQQKIQKEIEDTYNIENQQKIVEGLEEKSPIRITR